MPSFNRRGFLRASAGALAGAAGAASLPAHATLSAITQRTLGKSGVSCSLLGMGTGVKAWNGQSALTRKGHDVFMATVARAYERGLRYFDLAHMYGSHAYLREAFAQGTVVRDEVMLLTKSVAKNADAMRADLERFRKELDTDQLDVVLCHCMQKGDWPETMAPVLEVMEEAKQQGHIRAHGVSCHHLDALKRAAELDWCDVILTRINPYGVKMDGPVDDVVPVIRHARANGKGVIGMKIAGEGKLAAKLPECIRFVLEKDLVDAMTIGFLAPEEVDGAVAFIDQAQQPSRG